jgi:hypothetical protein
MKFKTLYNDGNRGKYISKKLNNTEFDYWLILDVIDMDSATGEEGGDKYNVAIQAVSPQQAGQKNVDSALSACGFSDEQLERYGNDPVVQAKALSDYGIFAQLWQISGNNLSELLKQARKEAVLIELLFGFYMDRPENRIGQNGWQLIQGQDIREFLGMS